MRPDALLDSLVKDRSPERLRVYADVALEHGDVHGELVALQCAREASGGPRSRRERDLMADALLRLGEALGATVHGEFVRGFIDTLEVSVQPGTQLAPLTQLPTTKLLRQVVLRSGVWHQLGELTPFWARFPVLPTLEALTVSREVAAGDLPPELGRVAPLGDALPSLRALDLHGVGHRLEDLVCLELRSFTASLLSASTIPALVAAQWPRLESLELEFGPAQPEEAEPLFGPLLDAPMSAVLKRVCVRSPWPEFFSAALPRSVLGRGREVSV